MRGRFSILNGVLTISPNIGEGIDQDDIRVLGKSIKETLKIEVKPIDVITEKQRAFIMCICRDIAYLYYGSHREQERVRQQATGEFLDYWNHKVGNMDDLLSIDKLSLSNCSKEVAWEFTQYLINVCLWLGFEEFSGVFREKLREALEFDQFHYNFVLSCLYNKTCAKCGAVESDKLGIDLHHYLSVNNISGRKNDDGTKLPIIPLCRACHTDLHSNYSREAWTEKYKLSGIILGDKQAKELRKIYNFKKAIKEDIERFEGPEQEE